VIGAEVYWKSTGGLALGKSAGRDCCACLRRVALAVYRKSTDHFFFDAGAVLVAASLLLAIAVPHRNTLPCA